ncbi:hypothetical protein CYMTET_13950 [Cymbomonas tetramitiformis]|uniref:Uncharacterized protein n=1 Tax=Cymbomonas tetramitiformis TaxID=36881 RepID=A0AAE0LAP7_9CHLO|nr:hypothetical protein CYMTET_13950 [Cymbomonas tetramitiformis]
MQHLFQQPVFLSVFFWRCLLIISLLAALAQPSSISHASESAAKSLSETSQGYVVLSQADKVVPLGKELPHIEHAIIRSTPVKVNNLAFVTQAVGGYDHSLFLTSSGKVYGCGKNGGGQLGDGTNIDRDSIVPALVKSVTTIASGDYTSFFFGAEDSVVTVSTTSNQGPAAGAAAAEAAGSVPSVYSQSMATPIETFYGFYGFYGWTPESVTSPRLSANTLFDGLPDAQQSWETSSVMEPSVDLHHRCARWLHNFSGLISDTVDLPPVAVLGSAPRTIHLQLRTFSAHNYAVLSTGKFHFEYQAFNIVSYGSRGRCIGVARHLHDLHCGHPQACTPVNDGAWHHIAVTLDEGGTLKVYVDGHEDNRADDCHFNTSGQTNYLGRSNNEANPDPFIGQVYAPTFITSALSPADVADLALVKDAQYCPLHPSPLSLSDVLLPVGILWVEPTWRLPVVTLRPGEKYIQQVGIYNEGSELHNFVVRVRKRTVNDNTQEDQIVSNATDSLGWLKAEYNGWVPPKGRANITLVYTATANMSWDALQATITVTEQCDGDACATSNISQREQPKGHKAGGLPTVMWAKMHVVNPSCGADGNGALKDMRFIECNSTFKNHSQINRTMLSESYPHDQENSLWTNKRQMLCFEIQVNMFVSLLYFGMFI